MKKIFLEARKLHSLYNELIHCPPEGYEFVTTARSMISTPRTAESSLHRRLLTRDATKTIYDYVRPIGVYFVNKLRASRQLRPENVDLTYASQHLVFRKERWVADGEHARAFSWYGKTKFVKKLLECIMRSDYCKKIITWTEMGKKSILASFDCRGFEDKVEVVNLAVRPRNFEKNFEKNFDSDKVKLLFVGTGNQLNGDNFALKGGNEVLKAFEFLRKKYKNLELTVRCYVPPHLKEKYASFENLRIIDQVVPWEALDHEFKTADIFLFPSHATPGMVILDAMSYELPVVTSDVWANSEMVDDGKTGLLVKGSSRVRYYDEYYVPICTEPKFIRAVRQVDPKMLKELVEKTSILIDDEKLRRRMGTAGREEIEKGKFSVVARNKKLKKIFDEAIEN